MMATQESFAQTLLLKPSRAEVRLEQIRDAAVELFTRHGYYGTSMEDIASRLGLSAPTLYHYVRSKQALFLALHRDVMRIMVDAITRALDAAGDSPQEKLEAFIRAHVASHGEYRRDVALAEGELRGLVGRSRREVMNLRDSYQQILTEIIQRGNDEGTWSTDSRLASFAILAICNNVAVWYKPQGPRTLEEIGDYFVEFVTNGLLHGDFAPRKGKKRSR